VSLVIEAEGEGEEVAEDEVTGKCKGIKTWPLHLAIFFYYMDKTEDTSYSVLLYKEKLAFIS